MMRPGFQRFNDFTAKLISVVFHPMLMPFYGILIIFSAPTLLGFLPGKVKRILTLIVLINNVIIPLTLMPWFRLRNIISSWVLNDRSERTIPLFAATFFYFVTTYLIIRYQIPTFIKSFVLSAAVLSLAITIINFRIKISIHSAGAGAIMALIIILSVKMHTALLGLLISSVIVSGLVLSSRLWLNSHTPKEVWSGFFLGIAIPGFILSLL
jgi:hypothetical protein